VLRSVDDALALRGKLESGDRAVWHEGA
jgi:hypothetical protein